MACGKNTKKWKNAMATARRRRPRASLSKRINIAAAILGGKKSK